MQLAFQKLCKIYIYYGTFKATCYSVIHVTSHEGLRVSVPNLIVVSQTVWARRSARKIGPLASGLSRSLAVIESDYGTTGVYDVLVVNIETICHSRTDSKIISNIVKNANFPYSLNFSSRWGFITIMSITSFQFCSDQTRQWKQEAQLMLKTGSMRLAVSRGQQTWYHSTCYI